MALSKQSRYWSVARTKQATSRDAVLNVSRQGFEYYRGLYRERPTIRGDRPIKPLFPYYLLIKVNLRDDAWKSLSNTRGITHLFMSDDKPARVPDEHVASIRACENELGYYVDAAQEPPRFSAGESLRGTRGLFAECDAVYQGRDRCVPHQCAVQLFRQAEGS